MIGKTIGNFQIIALIGSGGIGEVYAGLDLMLERRVAVKALRPELMSRKDIISRFRSEAITLAKLNHPNIATVYAFIAEQGNYYLVMEFVKGWELQDIVARHGAIPLPVAFALFQQMLEGLGFAHRKGIVHRDIKPGNVMLTDKGIIKVMDFGIARVLGSKHLTREGHLVGTLEYMAPEQIRGEDSDVCSDIYSLGVLFYELITGRVPFTSNSEFELMRSQVEVIPPPPSEFVPDLPSSLVDIILRTLSKERATRFQTTDELSRALSVCTKEITLRDVDLEAFVNQLHSEQEQFEEDTEGDTEPRIQATRLAPELDRLHALTTGSEVPARQSQRYVSRGIHKLATLLPADRVLKLFEGIPYLGLSVMVVAVLAIAGLFFFGQIPFKPGFPLITGILQEQSSPDTEVLLENNGSFEQNYPVSDSASTTDTTLPSDTLGPPMMAEPVAPKQELLPELKEPEFLSPKTDQVTLPPPIKLESSQPTRGRPTQRSVEWHPRLPKERKLKGAQQKPPPTQVSNKPTAPKEERKKSKARGEGWVIRR